MSGSSLLDGGAGHRLLLQAGDRPPRELHDLDRGELEALHEAVERALAHSTAVQGAFSGTAPAGFWAFVDEQWAEAVQTWDTDEWNLDVTQRLVLAYLLLTTRDEQEAVSRLIELAERDYGSVRPAARRLYRRWQERARLDGPTTPPLS